jgi:hypothetical protein
MTAKGSRPNPLSFARVPILQTGKRDTAGVGLSRLV